jgi:HEAT repeat protein
MKLVRCLAVTCLLVISLAAGVNPVMAAGPAGHALAEPVPAIAGPDAEALRRNGVELTPEALIGVIEKACGKEVPAEEIATQIKNLGSARYAVREAAAARLVETGPVAIPALRRAMASDDAELSKRARELADRILNVDGSPTLTPAVRVLSRQRERSAVGPFVKLLPFATDADLKADLWYGLDAIARRHPGIVELVGRSLNDPAPARRALAAHFLARFGTAEQRDRAAGVLKDSDPHVRLRAAQGLVAARDLRGVPALIDLLADDEPPVRWEAADLLRWLADPGPDVPGVNANRTDARKCRDAWAAWWEAERAKFDVAKAFARPARPGLQVVVDNSEQRVSVVGSDGTRYWTLGSIRGLNEARPTGTGLVVLRREGAEATEMTTYDWIGGRTWSRSFEVEFRSIARQADGGWAALRVTDPRVSSPRFYALSLTRRGELAKHVRAPEIIDSLEGVRVLPSGEVLIGHGIKFNFHEGTISRLVAFDPATGKYRELLPKDVCGIEPNVEQTPNGDFLAILHFRGQPPTRTVYRFNGGEKSSWQVECPQAEHASGTRNGLVLVSLRGRVAAYAADGRCVAEVPVGGSVDRTYETLPLARLGFDPSPEVRVENTVAYRVRRLKSRNPAERRMSAESLAELGPRAVSAARVLREAKADADEQVRQAAERAFGAVDEEGLRSALATAERASEPDAKLAAMQDLGRYVEAAEAITVLLKYLQDPNAKVRLHAASRLSNCHVENNTWVSSLRHESDRILPALVKAAHDPNADVRLYALLAIGPFGRNAAKFVPQLRDLIADKDYRVAAPALRAIAQTGTIEDEATFRLVVDQMLDVTRHERVREWAVVAAANGSGTRTDIIGLLIRAYPTLPPFTRPPDSQAREFCLESLSAVGGGDQRVVQFLTECVANSDEAAANRLRAARCLANKGKAAAAAVPTLKKLSESRTDPDFASAIKMLCEELKAKSGGAGGPPADK